MKKVLSLTIAIVMVLGLIPFAFNGCSSYQYDEEWIIGKSPNEIIERYGEPFSVTHHVDDDGNETDLISSINYMTKEPRVGFMDTDSAEFFKIWFDTEGKAYKTEENWIPPGGYY